MSTRTADVLPGGHAVPLANDRFKTRARYRTWLALAAAVLFHVLLFAIDPAFLTTEEAGPVAAHAPMQAIRVLPEVGVPTPPEPIEKPAAPVVAPVALDAAITIPPTTLIDELPAPEIPMPPAQPTEAAEELAGYEHIMPYMVAPELKNREEVARALQRKYPRALQAAGIEGVVLVWFWIDEKGVVQRYEIKGPSGHAAFDEAAIEVVDIMRFSPAVHRGEPVRVIVALPIRFRMQ